MAKNKYPKRIVEEAERQHANSIKLLHKEMDWAAYSIGFIGEDGLPMPTGLPIIYQLFDDGSLVELYGDEAFEFIRRYLSHR